MKKTEKTEATELKEYIYTIKQSIEVTIYSLGFVILFIMLLNSTLKALSSVNNFVGQIVLWGCVIGFSVIGLICLIIIDTIKSNIEKKLHKLKKGN